MADKVFQQSLTLPERGWMYLRHTVLLHRHWVTAENAFSESDQCSCLINISPFASVVLSEDGDHPLHGAQDGSMDDDWSGSVVAILPVKHEVKINANSSLEQKIIQDCTFCWHISKLHSALWNWCTMGKNIVIDDTTVLHKWTTKKKKKCAEHNTEA